MFDYFSAGEFSGDDELALIEISRAIYVTELVDRVLTLLLLMISLLTCLH